MSVMGSLIRKTRGRFVWAVAVSACVGLFAAFIFARSVWSVDALVRDGRGALGRNHPAAALQIARSAVQQAPDSLAAWRLLADAAEKANDRKEAVSALTHLTAADASRAADYWM